MWPCFAFPADVRTHLLRLATPAAAMFVAVVPPGNAASSHAVAARADSLITEARAAARNDAHTPAIDLYRRALEVDPDRRKDTVLALARELTWAGRFVEAESELAAYLDRRPKDRDVRLHRALNCSWAGNIESALAEYDDLLRDDPDDVDAGLGRARMLSWAGRLKEAEAEYGLLERAHPEIQSGAIGRAQVLNWAGRSRAALKIYETVLAASPDEAAAIEGKALAEKWLGRPDLALMTLDRRSSEVALTAMADGLRAAIRRDLAPGSGTVADYTEDTQDFRLWSVRQEVIVHPSPLVQLTPWVSFRREERRSEFELEEIWAGIGAASRLSTALSFSGGAAFIPNPGTDDGAPRVSGEAYLNLEPDDFLKLTLAGSRSLFTVINHFTPAPRVDRLTGDSFGFVASRKLDVRSSIQANYDYSIYNLEADDAPRFRHNGRVRVRTEVSSARPKLWLEAGYQHTDFNGYAPLGIWTPDRFQSLQFTLDSEWKIPPGVIVSGGVQGGTQREQQEVAGGALSGDWGAFGGFNARLAARIAGVDVSASGGHANASLETGRGYRRTWVSLGLARGF